MKVTGPEPSSPASSDQIPVRYQRLGVKPPLALSGNFCVTFPSCRPAQRRAVVGTREPVWSRVRQMRLAHETSVSAQ